MEGVIEQEKRGLTRGTSQMEVFVKRWWATHVWGFTKRTPSEFRAYASAAINWGEMGGAARSRDNRRSGCGRVGLGRDGATERGARWDGTEYRV